MKTIILLSALYILSAGQDQEGSDCDEGTYITGPSGVQCCVESENECSSTTALVNDEIECGDNFSCCTCKSILCGPNCDKFVAGGDSAAYAVKSITINGAPDNPTKIECGGDRSCEDAVITASYVAELNCGGDNSCQNLQILVNDGYVEKIICGGDDACRSSQMTINNPSKDFQIECKEPSSCQDLALVVIIPAGSSVSDFKGFGCEAQSACEGASITLNNQGTNTINIEEINCEAPAACKNARFSLIGDFKLKECKCGDQGGCMGATGIADCFDSLDKFECKETACEGQTITIENPKNDFELLCENCKGATIKIVVDDNAEDGPITDFKGIKCGDPGACEDTKIYIENRQSKDIINVEKIECNNGQNTCARARFDAIPRNKVIYEEIKCEPGSCDYCRIGRRRCYNIRP